MSIWGNSLNRSYWFIRSKPDERGPLYSLLAHPIFGDEPPIFTLLNIVVAIVVGVSASSRINRRHYQMTAVRKHVVGLALHHMPASIVR
jgi:hypothetical protein